MVSNKSGIRWQSKILLLSTIIYFTHNYTNFIEKHDCAKIVYAIRSLTESWTLKARLRLACSSLCSILLGSPTISHGKKCFIQYFGSFICEKSCLFHSTPDCKKSYFYVYYEVCSLWNLLIFSISLSIQL